MNYFSMFAGIAGFEKGIEDASKSHGQQQGIAETRERGCGIVPESTKSSQSPKWGNDTCIGYSEIDRYASAIYKYHYPNIQNYGDATAIVPESLPPCDCIVGGFPCQSFSVAGKRGAFSDTRGTLFFEICRIARVKKPAYLFLENVKGLLSAPYTEDIQEWAESDFNSETGEPTPEAEKRHFAIPGTKGWVFLTILNSLWELGYDVQWQLFNSKYHGVPQNRERVFIIASLRGKCEQPIFPIGTSNEADNVLQGCKIGAITARRGNAQSDGDYVVEGDEQAQEVVQAIDANYGKGNAGFAGSSRALVQMGQAQRIREIDGCASTLQGLAGGQGGKTGLYAVPQPNIIEVGNYQPSGYREGGLVVSPDGISPTMRGTRTDNIPQIIHENKSGTQTPHREAQALRSGASHNYQTVSNAIDPDGYLRSGARPRDENGKAQLLPIGYRRIRRLTPIECERLQGFPDNWTKYGLFEDGKVREISDTQRYKCLGNAVTTNVPRDIVMAWIKTYDAGVSSLGK